MALHIITDLRSAQVEEELVQVEYVSNHDEMAADPAFADFAGVFERFQSAEEMFNPKAETEARPPVACGKAIHRRWSKIRPPCASLCLPIDPPACYTTKRASVVVGRRCTLARGAGGGQG